MDKINMRGIEFFAYHGVLESEKELGQGFSIDCEIEIDSSICGDDLSKTVNYADVTCEIVDFCTKNRFALLEMLLNRLASHILLKFNIIKTLTLTVHKPHAPVAAVFSDISLTIKRGWTVCYLAIGSNLGDRYENLDAVWQEIEKNPYIRGISKSDYIETKPYGVTDQPDFLNGAIKIETILTPIKLLEFCKNTERLRNRVRTRHWGERTLDVDILMYGNRVIFNDEIKIPHPEMHLREFVLQPLVQIEPYLIHPVIKKNVSELLEDLK